MKYYVLEIADGDSKVAGKAVYEYETKDKAIASYHKKIGTAMDSELYTSHLCMVVDSNGNIWGNNTYIRTTANSPIEE